MDCVGFVEAPPAGRLLLLLLLLPALTGLEPQPGASVFVFSQLRPLFCLSAKVSDGGTCCLSLSLRSRRPSAALLLNYTNYTQCFFAVQIKGRRGRGLQLLMGLHERDWSFGSRSFFGLEVWWSGSTGCFMGPLMTSQRACRPDVTWLNWSTQGFLHYFWACCQGQGPRARPGGGACGRGLGGCSRSRLSQRLLQPP